MGKILSLFSKRDPSDVFLDFENARPTSNQAELYNKVEQCLRNGNQLLGVLTNYGTGCAELIRVAFSTPTPQTEEAAFRAVMMRVSDIKQLFDFAFELESLVPQLLRALAAGEASQTLADQQSLAKQLADVFSFALIFDDLKAHCPQMQNDFSYYRRYYSRYKGDPNLQVQEFDTTLISMFIAHGTPLMNSLITATKSMQAESVQNTLAAMANICATMVQKRKFGSNEQIYQFCLRGMTGAIILYDHVAPLGAFHKRSPIKIKKCAILVTSYPAPEEFLSSLCGALKFNSKNFDAAPPDIAKILNNEKNNKFATL
eukprot:gnl/Hemi2/19797_TR6562_c0_g1_i1.p1 gnl/Hemi2/19797_TR6562_c0_g1~~gnl/Hemi2/19797_TR6562_c0_g1_i1.p1  ORF type:complete len:315 (-),score=68.40 gnl/Hemi2/19797_TR6562_c0_g1_i1:98-1042(-)